MRREFRSKTLKSGSILAKELIGCEAHKAIARQAVRESAVLLKNENSVLPIKPGKRVLVLGHAADNIAQQCGGWSLSWQGDGVTNQDFQMRARPIPQFSQR